MARSLSGSQDEDAVEEGTDHHGDGDCDQNAAAAVTSTIEDTSNTGSSDKDVI